jgi:hypothetical protein
MKSIMQASKEVEDSVCCFILTPPTKPHQMENQFIFLCHQRLSQDFLKSQPLVETYPIFNNHNYYQLNITISIRLKRPAVD